MLEVPLAVAAAATDLDFDFVVTVPVWNIISLPSQYYRATFPPNNKPVGSFIVFRCRGDIRLF